MLIYIGIGALVLLLLYGRAFVSADPKKIAVFVRNVGGAAAIALGLLLAARGGVVAGVPLILLGAGVMFPGWMRRFQAPGGGWGADGISEVRTAWVTMRLDRGSGGMDGDVVRGAFMGRRLSELTEAEVRRVVEEARGDRDSAALLHAYMTRRFGGGAAGGAGDAGARAGQGAMSEDEALAVLGLTKGATPDQVRAAHKRLMVKLHPDQGGTSWLAAKLNAARDRLLAGR